MSRQPGSPDHQTADEVSARLLQSAIKPFRPPVIERDSSSSSDNDDDEYAALHNPVSAGAETEILIDKGSTGLGLSIVGGADTLLVSQGLQHLCICVLLFVIIFLLLSISVLLQSF